MPSLFEILRNLMVKLKNLFENCKNSRATAFSIMMFAKLKQIFFCD
jgi:hypothetical protein